jgi:hypothetical protein
MNRKNIRVIGLVALVVAAGAYVWAQRSASTVKPAQTSTVAVKKPGAATAAKTTAKSAASAPAPANKKIPNATPAAKGPAPKAAAVDARMASLVGAKPAAVAPAAPIAAPPVVPALAASWRDHLQKGAYLAEKLRPRLPDGADLIVASAGFRDLQQFVSAVTAAHNLNLNFDELKRRVVTDGKGLAPAIDAMKRVASATIEEQRAEYEARGLIQEAKRQPAPPAPAAKNASTKPQAKKPFRAPSGA